MTRKSKFNSNSLHSKGYRDMQRIARRRNTEAKKLQAEREKKAKEEREQDFLTLPLFLQRK